MPKLVNKTCKNCSKSFKVESYRLNTAQYCSQKCSHIGRHNSVSKFCLVCQKHFLVKASEIRRNGGKFCSRKCFYKNQKGKQFSPLSSKNGFKKNNKYGFKKGKDHYNWKGGITPKNCKIRRSKKYSQWRQAVFERDNFTCIWCGEKDRKKLQADHIKQFAFYPLLRFKISNGRTLCIDCHKKTDSWFYFGRYLKKRYHERNLL